MKSDSTSCIDCGGALPLRKTRPALRCGPCNKTKRRIKARARVACLDCGAFFDPPGGSGRFPERCGSCKLEHKRAKLRERQARWRVANPEAYRKYDREYKAKQRLEPGYNDKRNADFLRLKYGLTVAEFDLLLEQQGGACAICAGPRSGPGKRFHVDHNHKTGQVRGLLCGNCNTAIGLLGDDPERVDKVAVYLRR